MPEYIVRCGSMRTLHCMSSSLALTRGTEVVTKTPRGLEIGLVLGETASTLQQAWREQAPTGEILRPVSAQDRVERDRLLSAARREFEEVRQIVRDMQLPMDVVDVERIFGGERVVVYFLSEQRVDFRELVRRLAAELQTRIEMRQIGVRDEARLLADYGDCGKPVCCNTHLADMPPVSMRMAKLQKATLDPNKISGRCGRLKCCLRYEQDTYEALLDQLPPSGSHVLTSHGRGRVLGQEILAQQLLLEMEDRRRIMVQASEVLTVLKRGSGN
jgi:cell fate regulator YaaT (PSP1 superfamily)